MSFSIGRDFVVSLFLLASELMNESMSRITDRYFCFIVCISVTSDADHVTHSVCAFSVDIFGRTTDIEAVQQRTRRADGFRLPTQRKCDRIWR